VIIGGELRACDYYDEFDKEKIIYAEISINGAFTIDDKNIYSDTTSYIIPINSITLLSILNSKVCNFHFHKISSEIRGGFFRWKKQYVELLIIPKKFIEKEQNNATFNQIEILVKELMLQKKEISLAITDSDKKLLEQKAGLLDRQIDQMVYGLYGLTEEEIAIVEAAV
jgi:hypothetical protein